MDQSYPCILHSISMLVIRRSRKEIIGYQTLLGKTLKRSTSLQAVRKMCLLQRHQRLYHKTLAAAPQPLGQPFEPSDHARLYQSIIMRVGRGVVPIASVCRRGPWSINDRHEEQ